MAHCELNKLKRKELLEILLQQKIRSDELEKELEEAKSEIERQNRELNGIHSLKRLKKQFAIIAQDMQEQIEREPKRA